jgi:hypothetical protein
VSFGWRSVSSISMRGSPIACSRRIWSFCIPPRA